MSELLPEERHGWWTALSEARVIPPKFTIERLLPAGICFLVGPPKSSKTTVTMAMALSVAGLKHNVLPETLQRVPHPGRVMVVNAEHQAGELRQMVEEGFGVPVPDDDSILVADDPWAWRLDDPGAVKQLLDWLNEFDPRLFILDPLVHFHTLDENESADMIRLLRPVQQWAKKRDATALLVHHARKPKTGEQHTFSAADARGSGALFGMADGMLTLTGKGRAGVHFDVVLKRGESWAETIKLGVWGEQVQLRVDATTVEVYKAIANGPATYATLVDRLGLSKSTVAECIRALRQLGALDASNNVTVDGQKLVEAAALRWTPKGGSK